MIPLFILIVAVGVAIAVCAFIVFVIKSIGQEQAHDEVPILLQRSFPFGEWEFHIEQETVKHAIIEQVYRTAEEGGEYSPSLFSGFLCVVVWILGVTEIPGDTIGEQQSFAVGIDDEMAFVSPFGKNRFIGT